MTHEIASKNGQIQYGEEIIQAGSLGWLLLKIK